LPGSLEEYIAELGRRTRKQVRRDINRLNESGNLEYKVAGTEQDVESTRELLIRLHQSRWTDVGMPGVFSSDKFRSFHDRIMLIALHNDWLRLGTLLLDGEPLACEYNLKYRNKIYSYQCGVKTSDDSNISVGTVADVYAIGNAISDGLKEYDFLIGATHYKNRLARNQREMVTMRIGKPSKKELVYRAVCKLKFRS
jgi:CelD/BcsL family acetyltransferase involved in cellulose biosynthesis